MERRAFVAATIGLLAAPLAGEAQQAGKIYGIGVMETTSLALNAANLDGLRQGLRELGYVEGQNFVIEYRSADDRPERFGALATDLARQKVDLILTRGNASGPSGQERHRCDSNRYAGKRRCSWERRRRRPRASRRECDGTDVLLPAGSKVVISAPTQPRSLDFDHPPRRARRAIDELSGP